MGRYVHPDIAKCPVVTHPDEWYQDVGSDLGWLPVGKSVDVNGMTVAEVLAAVGDDAASAAASLAEERAGRDRVTLVDQLAVIAQTAKEN